MTYTAAEAAAKLEVPRTRWHSAQQPVLAERPGLLAFTRRGSRETGIQAGRWGEALALLGAMVQAVEPVTPLAHSWEAIEANTQI